MQIFKETTTSDEASWAVSWERRRSQYNLFSTYKIEYCTGGLVSSENEAIILYTVEKTEPGSLKVHTSKKIRRHTRGEITFHFFFSSASGGIAWPLHFKFASYAYDPGASLSE